MKANKIFIILLAVTLVVASQSCKKGYLDGINDDPNYPYAVIPRVLLPGAEANLAYAQDGDMGRYTSLMVQYVTGATRQFFGYNQYTFSEEDFNNLWNNVYAATMSNFKTIMDINASGDNAGKYDAYDGVARILLAYEMGQTTDAWGDVPYSEAFQGNNNLTPAFDSQEAVYASMQQLLDDGITILTGSAIDDDLEVPGSDDFIYGGDLSAWVTFAHALKARFYIHLTKVDPDAASKALDEINAGGPMVNALYPWNSAGPGSWFQYIEQRDDIIYSEDNAYGLPDPACIAQMRANGDPRVGVYIDLNGDYWGSGYLGPFFAADNSPTLLMSEFERLFIQSEASLLTGDNAGAQTAFTEAIQSSMDYYGIDDSSATAYIGTHGTLAGDETAMRTQIIYEKWVANFLHPESWVDNRRTDNLLGLSPNQGTAIPERFIYPTNERLYNPNIPDPNSNLFSPQLWWNP